MCHTFLIDINMENYILIVLIFIFVDQIFPAGSCLTNEWQCTDGECIPSDGRCDNGPNCADESDESNCNPITCNEGQKLCTDLRGTSSCIPQSDKCDCGLPMTIENGNITLDVLNNTLEGASASVTCADGYIPTNSTVICQGSGLWYQTICEGKDCGSLPLLTNGSLTLTESGNTSLGARANVHCSEGFASAVSIIVCLSSGIWDAVNCSLVDCGTLPSISGGSLSLITAGNTSYRAQANVVCKDDLKATAPKITCLASGHWENASCTTERAAASTDQSETDLTVVIAVGVTLAVLLIAQLTISVALYMKSSEKTSENKVATVILDVLSAIPLIGIPVIVYRCRHSKFGKKCCDINRPPYLLSSAKDAGKNSSTTDTQSQRYVSRSSSKNSLQLETKMTNLS